MQSFSDRQRDGGSCSRPSSEREEPAKVRPHGVLCADPQPRHAELLNE